MKFSLQSTVPLLSSAILFSYAPSPVFAQTSDASVLDEVIVTARRVEENLQDTPIAITALSAESLE
jgi:iron complex outermembrane receptor protein